MPHETECDPAEVAAQHIVVWNDGAPASRHAGIRPLFTAQARNTGPVMASAGHDVRDAMMAAVQERFAGLRFELAGRHEVHHDVVRCS